MRFNEYSHRHGKELLKVLHPETAKEVTDTLRRLAPFPHGARKNQTVTKYLVDEFSQRGWETEAKADFRTTKTSYLDLCKWKVAIEIECSKFEMFFRDFFRMMLLYERQEIDAGIIITLGDMAYQRWKGKAKPYTASRASLQKLKDILTGDYATIVRVPLWCIGIE